MIEPFRICKKADYPGLLSFIKQNFDYDFYYTKENSRFYVTDIYHLKQFIKDSLLSYTYQLHGDHHGVILLWKSVGGGKKRFYIKIQADTLGIAKDLLTVLLWNIDREVFIKIRKDNKFLPVLRNKGFKFLGGRGIQVLLSFKPKKDKKDGRHYNNDFRDSD
jgi:hypothetical protein